MDDLGNPWFVAKDVCDVLGYVNGRDAIAKHCKGGATVAIHDGSQNRHLTIIPEPDVYRLIFRSKLPAAERFETWVTSVVLPSIRKTGGYIPVNHEEDDEMTVLARAVLIADKTIKMLEADKAALETDNAAMHEKLDFSTVDAFRALHKGEYWTHGQKTQLGKIATKLCHKEGIEVEQESRYLGV